MPYCKAGGARNGPIMGTGMKHPQKSMTPSTAILITIALVAAMGCAPDGGEGGTASFDQAVSEGASCSDLYEIRNSYQPDEPDIARMNERLREIGCFSSSSTRTDR